MRSFHSFSLFQTDSLLEVTPDASTVPLTLGTGQRPQAQVCSRVFVYQLMKNSNESLSKTIPELGLTMIGLGRAYVVYVGSFIFHPPLLPCFFRYAKFHSFFLFPQQGALVVLFHPAQHNGKKMLRSLRESVRNGNEALREGHILFRGYG